RHGRPQGRRNHDLPDEGRQGRSGRNRQGGQDDQDRRRSGIGRGVRNAGRTRHGARHGTGTEEVTGCDARETAPAGAVFAFGIARRHPLPAQSARFPSRRAQDSLDIFLQQLVNGLTLGSVYAIVALGYTMVYGIIQLINFAHGEVVMIGAMVSLTVINALLGANLALPPLVVVVIGALAAIPVCMAVGYALERVAYRPLRRAPRLAPLITAIGLSIVLQHVALMIFSRSPLVYPQIVDIVSYHVTSNPDGARITNVQIAIIGISVAMMGGLLLLIYRTKLGIAMRATAQSQQIAGLMGIDINFVIAVTFVIGAGLAAVAGVMVGTYYGIAQ